MLFRSRHSHRRRLWPSLQYQITTAIGMVFNLHSSSQLVTWYERRLVYRYVATASVKWTTRATWAFLNTQPLVKKVTIQ